MIEAAQARSQARVEDRIETKTIQQEASWRERALNAEDEIRNLRRSFRLSGNSSVTCWDNYASRMVLGLNKIGTVCGRNMSTFLTAEPDPDVNETNSNADWMARGRTSRT